MHATTNADARTVAPGTVALVINWMIAALSWMAATPTNAKR